MALLSSGCGGRLLPEIIFRQGWSFNPGLAQCTTKTPKYSFNLFCLVIFSFSLQSSKILPHLLKVYKQKRRRAIKKATKGEEPNQTETHHSGDVKCRLLVGQEDSCDVAALIFCRAQGVEFAQNSSFF